MSPAANDCCERVAFQELPQIGEFLQVFRGDRRHFEAARAFRDDQAFGRQPVEQFAQRADADAVAVFQPVELELLRRRQPAENDVGS